MYFNINQHMEECGNMIKLAPSVLAANFAALGQDINTVEQAGCEYLHLDVMDGMFVPNISIGPPVIRSIRKNSKLVFDVHLMVERPERYLKDFAEAGADIITIHAEAVEDLKKVIMTIKDLGIKASVSIKPETKVEVLTEVLPLIDMVLIMTVNPGFGGQSLIPHTIDKVRELRELCNRTGNDIDIEVDGGINIDNVATLIEAGANVIVAGTSVFSGDIKKNVMIFKEVFADAIGGTETR